MAKPIQDLFAEYSENSRAVTLPETQWDSLLQLADHLGSFPNIRCEGEGSGRTVTYLVNNLSHFNDQKKELANRLLKEQEKLTLTKQEKV